MRRDPRADPPSPGSPGRPGVFVTRKIPAAGLESLVAGGAEVRVGRSEPECPLDHGELRAEVARCHGLLCLLTETIDRPILEAGGELLRGVATMAVGHDNIDLAAATELGLPVANTPGVLTETTADCTWAMLLALARRLREAEIYMRSGSYRLWGPELFCGTDPSPGGSGRRKVLGIVGFGRIGSAVARRAQGFDMEVLAHDPSKREEIEARSDVTWAELYEVLARSDFLTLHAPLKQTSHHLIGAPELAAMKPTALVINTARGPLIDEKALVRALAEGEIAGAALDVYEEEPAMAPGLAELPNVLLLPHIASASRDTRERMARMAAENLLAHLAWRPAPNVLNPEVYETAFYRRRRQAGTS